MTVPQLNAIGRNIFSLDNGLRWWDSDTGCTMVMSTPSAEPDLWSEYVCGAKRSYRKHGVEVALDLAALKSGKDTQLFFAAVDEDGRVVGGLRAKGPLEAAEESHAVVEWAGRPGLDAVRKMLTDRLPFGVVEMKAAWVTDDPTISRLLTRTIARTPFPTMAALNAQFVVATAASHVLERWRTSGGVVAKIPATPYPDDRYRTKMMWWDRSTFTNHADPVQVSKVFAEMSRLGDEFNRAGAAGLGVGSGM